MKFTFVLATALIACGFAGTVSAETLAQPSGRHHAADSAGMPARGMSMAQVERRFGAPESKSPTAGGDAPRHPPIHRWHYSGYTVYFERSRVIHSVADGAIANPSS